MGCSETTLYARINAGYLKPIKIGRQIFFNPEEVLQVSEKLQGAYRYKQRPGLPKTAPPTSTSTSKKTEPAIDRRPPARVDTATIYKGYEPADIGKLSAKATKAFDEGKSIRNVVIELEVSYEIAAHLYGQWKMSGQEWHITARQLAAFQNRFSWDEDVPTVEGFTKALEKYIADEISRALSEKSNPDQPTEPTP